MPRYLKQYFRYFVLFFSLIFFVTFVTAIWTSHCLPIGYGSKSLDRRIRWEKKIQITIVVLRKCHLIRKRTSFVCKYWCDYVHNWLPSRKTWLNKKPNERVNTDQRVPFSVVELTICTHKTQPQTHKPIL